MKKSRFAGARSSRGLREFDAATLAAELDRKHGVHANTVRLRRDRYAGLESSNVVRPKQLEGQSRRKDRIIAKLTPEVYAMNDPVEKRLEVSQREAAVRALPASGVSAIRASELIGYTPSILYNRR